MQCHDFSEGDLRRKLWISRKSCSYLKLFKSLIILNEIHSKYINYIKHFYSDWSKK